MVVEEGSWLPPSSYWTTKTVESNKEVTDCKAEWYSIYLRYARSLRQSNSLPGKGNLKHLGWFSGQESEKNQSNTNHERFLSSSMYTRKDRVLCRFTIFKGIKLSGRAFGCSPRGHWFESACLLKFIFKKTFRSVHLGSC